MHPTLQDESLFHLTGRRPARGLDPVEGLGLRPALLARYGDLTRLRYDFPLVLVAGRGDGAFARSLTELVNELLQDVAPRGIDGEGVRRHVLRVEHEIRRLVGAGARGALADLWSEAVARVAEQEHSPLADYLVRAGAALGVDGEVLDCDEQMPARLFAHAWRAAQARKGRRARADLDRLIVRLNDILRADFVRSEAGTRPDSLRAAMGSSHHGLFDFAAMSRLLRHGAHGSALPPERRARIERALEVLRSQRFFPAEVADGARAAAGPPYEFMLGSCREVLDAFGERRPAMVELVKAIAIAELEADGRYDPSRHDELFAAFGADSLGPADLERFPDYLLCLAGDRGSDPGDVSLMELLSAGVPVKVLVQVDDVLEESAAGAAHFAFGVRSMQLASMATALDGTFVLQSAASNLLQVRGRIERGLSVPGPALFSVFAPGRAAGAVLPPYLVAAAAMQSRAFPAFTYDPAAGPDLADRFSLEDNPQPERDWTQAQIEYADAELQRVRQPVGFTFADFVFCDPRHARHFARVPPAAWSDELVPVADWVAGAAAPAERVPVLLAADAGGLLQKVVVDERIVQATRRCRESWHRLQELGGVRSSHAERLLARERARWEEQKRAEIAALGAGTPPAARVAGDAAPAAGAEPAAEATVATAEPTGGAAEPARAPDEAYIETQRCSSCNECTQINDRMFGYNADRQAYLKDLKAGTYRQLVEAAESCQVSIIHPGKPWDPREPGLEELVERARIFNEPGVAAS